jgi:PKD repeat protein
MNPQIIHSHFKTKLARAFVTSAFAILLGVTGLATHAQTVIWSDNFNIPDTTSLDGSDQTGRHTGLLANNVVGRSGGVQLTITGDELNIFKTGSGNDGRMRFCDVAHTDGNNRWDWASGTAGSTITTAGGMQIDFDWTAANNTSGDWIAYSVGITPNSDVNLRILNSGTDSGIIFRNNGSATVFQNGTGGASANFDVSSLTRHVTLLYAFTSFADGSPVVLTASINGTQVMSQSFTWNGHSGVQNMEISSYANGTRIDNFTVSAVAPPITLSLAADTTASPSTNFYVGGAVTFSASFVGTQPITNQWEVNTGSGFVPLTGATNTTLTLTNLQLINSGASYALFASNPAGASNSTPVTLTVLAAPTNIAFNVQFTGGWLGGGYAATQTGAAVIGTDGDVWNPISNTTGGTSPAGLARGTNIALLDVVSVGTAVTMDYVGDYIFNGAAFGNSNPFKDAGAPYANLMTGYMGSVSQGSVPDTNTVTLHHLTPGSYDLYLFSNGRTDGQGRITVFSANGQTAVCGPNSGNYTLIAGANYVHLIPTVTTNGVLNISAIGTTDNGQGLWNGIQVYGPVTAPTLALSSDTTSDSPGSNYAGRNITLTAGFAGFPTPTLQWKVDKGSGFVNVSASATNSSLTLANAQTSDAGSYALFAANVVGVLNSTPMALTILPAPTGSFGVNVNAQFDGTTFTGTHATPQVGPAVIGNASDYWNPVSNPNPVGGDTNRISSSIVGLLDALNIGTSWNLSYLGDQDYNSGTANPFAGSGSPAENLMQAALRITGGRTGTVSLTGLPSGTYDLYLYSSAGNTLQTPVTRFAANGSYDAAGPNSGNNVLTVEGNYVHLTPIVSASGVLTVSLAGLGGTADASLNGLQLSGPGATVLPPVASFTATPTNAFATQAVAFTDTSSGNITNWVWSFGDGSSVTNSSGSTTHAYAAAGTYTVSLTAKGPSGSSTTNQVGYVTVYARPTLGRPVLSAGSLTFSGTGGIPNAQYRILTSTNVALPLADWTPVATNTFAPDGSYSYTQSFLTNAASFFLLVTP